MSKHQTSLLFIFLFSAASIFGQKQQYTFPLDAESVVGYLKDKKLIYRNEWLTEEEIARTPSYQPMVEYLADKNQWKVTSRKYKSVNKKRYRKTNGITIEYILTVMVDAQNGKIVSKKKTKKKMNLNF